MIDIKKTTTTKLKISNCCIDENNQLFSEDDGTIDLLDVLSQYFDNDVEFSILVTEKTEETM